MNLFDALNYRNNCLICQQPMEIMCYTKGLTVRSNERGLAIIRSKQSGIQLNFNGTCQKIFRMGLPEKLSSLKIFKECPDHTTNSFHARGYRKIGFTSAELLKEIDCAYAINISLNDDKTFSTQISDETIKYHDDKEFYHVNTSIGQWSKWENDHPNDLQTELLHGRFDQSLGNLCQLNIPYLDTSKIKDINHLIDKFKFLVMMS